MRTSLKHFYQDLRQPWQMAILLVTLVPLVPEYISFFLIIAAAVCALKDLRQRGACVRVDTIGKLMLVFIGYTAITLIYSGNRLNTLATVGMWLFFFSVYLIMNNLLTDPDRFDVLMLYITAVAGAVGLIAWCQYRIAFLAGGNTIRFWEWLDKIVYHILPIQLGGTKYVLRACSTFENPNVLSEYLTMVAPFVVYFNFSVRREELRLFSRVCLILTFGGIIFSFSRGGYVALLALAAVLILLNIRHRFTAVTLYVFSALLLVPDEVVERFFSIIPGIHTGEALLENILSSASPNVPITTPADIINQSAADLAISDRWRIWMAALQDFVRAPIFGYGAGVRNSWALMAEHGINAIHCHNIVLELLLEGGLIGLVLMALIGFKAVKNGIELLRDGYGVSFWVGFAVLGSAGCFLLQGMVDYPLLTPKLICIFMMLLGIAERTTRLFSGRGIPVRARIRKRFCSQSAQ